MIRHPFLEIDFTPQWQHCNIAITRPRSYIQQSRPGSVIIVMWHRGGSIFGNRKLSWEPSKQEVSFFDVQNRLYSSNLAFTNILQSWCDFVFLPCLLSCSPLINTVVINVSQVVNSVHTSSVDQSGKRSKCCWSLVLFVAFRQTWKVLINLCRQVIMIKHIFRENLYKY